jgi:hypothetical protein
VKLGKNDDQLASICEGCHTVIHFDGLGNKRSAEETDRLLLERNESTDFPTPKVDLRKRRGELLRRVANGPHGAGDDVALNAGHWGGVCGCPIPHGGNVKDWGG